MTRVPFSLLLLCGLGVFAGCDSIGDATDGMRQRMAAHNEPRLHQVAATPRAAYLAGRAAAESMGFRFQRGGPAQGELEAISRLTSDDNLRRANQRRLKVRFRATAEGTEIRLWLTEITEEDSSSNRSLSTERTLTNSPLYDVFFRTLEQHLVTAPDAPIPGASSITPPN